jgi:hypothetical protein
MSRVSCVVSRVSCVSCVFCVSRVSCTYVFLHHIVILLVVCVAFD